MGESEEAVSEAPLRDVVRAFESTGPKGGRELVHVLSCGCWVINRRRVPAKQLRCISCRVREEQGGGPRVPVPRVEDVAWQAFRAGIASGLPRWELHAVATFNGPTAVQRAFQEWWAKR